MKASTIVGLVAAVVALIALSAGYFASSAPQALPSFVLTNQSGEVIRAEQLNGRIAIISFMFTNCYDVCPLVTAQLARVQTELAAASLGSTVRLISITLDPGTDTPEVLRGYAARFGAESNSWDLLTGDPDEVRRVVQAMGVFVIREDGSVGHDSPVLLVNARGEIVRRYTDTTRLSARIVDDIRHIRRRTAR